MSGQMLGTVPQHKEWGDTNNSYGWNWKRSTWFPVCNPNMTNRKWTSIYGALLYFNWSPKAFFSYEVLGKEHSNLLIGRWSTLLPQPPYSRYYSHCLLFYCEICVVLFQQRFKTQRYQTMSNPLPVGQNPHFLLIKLFLFIIYKSKWS